MINNLGDLDLGAAVPASTAGSPAIPTDAITAATFSGATGTTVNITVATAPDPGVVGKNVTITGVTTAATLTTITSAATPVFSGTGTTYWVTFTIPALGNATFGPALAVGQTVTLASPVNANYNIGGTVLAANAFPGVPAPTATTFSLAFGTNPGAFTADPLATIAVANGYNASFPITAVAGNVVSFTVTTNPGIYGSGGNAAFPAVSATGGGAAPIGTATGVAYDPATGRSCIGGWTGMALPSDHAAGGIFMPPPSNTAIGVNTFGGTTGVPAGFPAFLNGVLPNANNAVQPGEMVALNAAGVITTTALTGTAR